jgi:hypothetical protein
MPTSITRMVCDVRIGTSGFHYKHWKGSFYPERMPSAAMIEFQLQKFDTVELNNSFYRLPNYRPMFATHTIPLRNSSSGYFVPRHSIPSFHNVRIIERKSV